MGPSGGLGYVQWVVWRSGRSPKNRGLYHLWVEKGGFLAHGGTLGRGEGQSGPDYGESRCWHGAGTVPYLAGRSGREPGDLCSGYGTFREGITK